MRVSRFLVPTINKPEQNQRFGPYGAHGTHMGPMAFQCGPMGSPWGQMGTWGPTVAPWGSIGSPWAWGPPGIPMEPHGPTMAPMGPGPMGPLGPRGYIGKLPINRLNGGVLVIIWQTSIIHCQFFDKVPGVLGAPGAPVAPVAPGAPGAPGAGTVNEIMCGGGEFGPWGRARPLTQPSPSPPPEQSQRHGRWSRAPTPPISRLAACTPHLSFLGTNACAQPNSPGWRGAFLLHQVASQPGEVHFGSPGCDVQLHQIASQSGEGARGA